MLKDIVISGVICEFNPLHNGHKYLLDTIKKEADGYTVCVMSGNFVQRGECAVVDKYERTRMALKSGADLVIELPLPYAVSTAEKFAFGGVKLLDSLGCCDRIYFGSESGNTEKLRHIADVLLSDKYSHAISEEIKQGHNFATAREKVVMRIDGNESAYTLHNSNDILGIEYIKALKQLDSNIEPHTVTRLGAAHDGEAEGVFASAMAIRNRIGTDSYDGLMPEYNLEILKDAIESGKAPARLSNVGRSILADLRRASPEALRNVPDVREGIENKIIAAACKAKDLDDLYMLVKSKRYSHARIRRIVLSYYLGITSEYNSIPYIPILGMNDKGLDILKGKTNRLPFVVNYSDIQKLDAYARKLFELEAKADDLFGLMCPQIQDGGKYYTTPVIKA